MHKLAYPFLLAVTAAAASIAGPGCGSGVTTDVATGMTGASGSSGSSSGGITGGGGAGGEGAGMGGAGAGAGGAAPTPGCGDGKLNAGEQCDDGNKNAFDGCLPDCTKVEPIDTPALEWTYVKVPGTLCMNGDTAGFGISLNPDSKDVMIYLEGGGACFNDVCDFSAFSIPFIPPPDGIFNRKNPDNPVKDWSMIYVPYCTGDIHGGDADTELGGKVRHFRGYSNITRYLQMWVPTFADASNVLLTGISAGGFGSGLNAAQVADAFGPGHQMIVIDDSGPPVSNSVIPPCLQETFRKVWGLDKTILAVCGADCPNPNDFATGTLTHVRKHYPDMRFGLFSNTADLVIRAFIGFGWGNGKYDNCGGLATNVPADVYEDGLLALRQAHMGDSSTYYIGTTHFGYNFGQGHTALRSPSFWTTVIDGVQLSDWVGHVIKGQVQHVGP